MTNIGVVYYLCIEVQQMERSIFISQEGYAREMLKKFKMTNYKPVNTYVECGVKLSEHEDETKVDAMQFESLVGSLRYLTCTTQGRIFFLE